MKKEVVYLTTDKQQAKEFKQKFELEFEVQHFDNPNHFLACLTPGKRLDAIFTSANPASPLGLNLIRSIKKDQGVKAPVFWLPQADMSPALQSLLIEAGVSDIFNHEANKENILARLSYLTAPKKAPKTLVKKYSYNFKVPFGKRVFDLVFATTALLCLLPLFIVIALLIKLESKGPAFYYSYRVGTGYKIFKFWKFRSMRQDADQLLGSMKGMNQYQLATKQEVTQQTSSLCATCIANGTECQNKLYDVRGEVICEKKYKEAKRAKGESAFIKIVNDPRITRVGMFIRNTSIDELPQLFNVLKGDMSIIGNRPLPLYEAEKITTDEFAARFIAPAGITGLWQVSKRGKGDMSEEERKALDIEYAENYSMRKDLKILLSTIPALFQKENV